MQYRRNKFVFCVLWFVISWVWNAKLALNYDLSSIKPKTWQIIHETPKFPPCFFHKSIKISEVNPCLSRNIFQLPMISSMLSTLIRSFSPFIQRIPLDEKHVSHPFCTFSGAEVYFPWFTDIIYKTIQNRFRFFKTSLFCFDVIILHLTTFWNILW